MTTIACVLRLQPRTDFSRAWVLALREGLRSCLPSFDPDQLVCLTNSEDDLRGVVRTQPLTHDLPGWWSKIELFKPGRFTGRVLYLDLDSLPVGDLTDLVGYDGPLAMLSDFYMPDKPASGVMAWEAGEGEAIYTSFVKKRPALQGRLDFWIAQQLRGIEELQRIFPRQIVSFKKDARREPPPGTRLVCGHGVPRFSHPSAGWAYRTWMNRLTNAAR